MLRVGIAQFACICRSASSFVGTPPACARSSTPRVPELLEPSARMTNRLRCALQALGLATGAEVSARLAPKLGMWGAPTTLLRCLREIFTASTPAVRVLGLDDWAYKRGNTYGTILVDLERHRVIDLLPDRHSETVKVWLAIRIQRSR